MLDKKPKFGRPTKFKKEYCQLLIDHMEQGFSFESFAGKVFVAKQTLYDWLDASSDFLDAKAKGTQLSRIFWEGEGLKGLWNEGGQNSRNLNNVVWVFNMKNRFGWRDNPPERPSQESKEKLSIEDAVTLAKLLPKDK